MDGEQRQRYFVIHFHLVIRSSGCCLFLDACAWQAVVRPEAALFCCFQSCGSQDIPEQLQSVMRYFHDFMRMTRAACPVSVSDLSRGEGKEL